MQYCRGKTSAARVRSPSFGPSVVRSLCDAGETLALLWDSALSRRPFWTPCYLLFYHRYQLWTKGSPNHKAINNCPESSTRFNSKQESKVPGPEAWLCSVAVQSASSGLNLRCFPERQHSTPPRTHLRPTPPEAWRHCSCFPLEFALLASERHSKREL